MTSKRDYYEILEVQRNASQEDIRRAYRHKAMDFHPDRNKRPDAEDKFKEINEAYQVLGDAEKRTQYDRFGHAGVNSQAGGTRGFDGYDVFSGFGDIFDSFFGDVSGRGRRGPQRGRDIEAKVVLPFEEAAFGTEREVEVNRIESCSTCSGSGSAPGSTPETCHTCRGMGQVRQSQHTVFGAFSQVGACPACKGRGATITNPCTHCHAQGTERRKRRIAVKIPAGVESGMQVRLSHEGDSSPNGGQSGNLYLTIGVNPHPFFKRDGEDLLYDLPVSFPQAALGAELEVPNLIGAESLKIPAGTQPAAVFRIRGKGLAHVNSGRRGDLVVSVKLEVPTSVDSEQRRLLEELARRDAPEDDDGGSRQKGLFDKIKDVFD
jgi:molecular chaperone DnaJ